MSQSGTHPRKVKLYGVGVVAPQAANLKEFLKVVRKGENVLTLKPSLAHSFLVGEPSCRFEDCKQWLEEHHGPKRFSLLQEKSGDLVKFTVSTLVDALNGTPGLEALLKKLDDRVYVSYATGLGDLATIAQSGREWDNTLMKWNEFWAAPRNNVALRRYLDGEPCLDVPPSPDGFPPDSIMRFEALQTWNAFWTQQSQELKVFLKELAQIESEGVVGEDIDQAKLSLIRNKTRARRELLMRTGCPTPPWEGVSPNLLWNIPNIPSAQVSMLLGLHGTTEGSLGACASFGMLVHRARWEIQSGRVDAAIIGAVDVSPSNELVSAFFQGRLAVMGNRPGVPFCDLRGTHISGGAVTWVLAAEDVMEAAGIQPVWSIEILGSGVSSDAEHIITPSKEGPKKAIRDAFAAAGQQSIQMWDMHATGTPGDVNEFQIIEEFVPSEALISARKGIFGHGMAASGGWELTAQLLGGEFDAAGRYTCPPCGIDPQQIHPVIQALNRKIVANQPLTIQPETTNSVVCGKLSLGVGGMSACVIAQVAKK